VADAASVGGGTAGFSNSVQRPASWRLAATNLEDTKPENLKTMIEFTKEYGRYV